MSKLAPDVTGKVQEGKIVFPIRCPECPPGEWAEGFQDETAEKILSKENMVIWVR